MGRRKFGHRVFTTSPVAEVFTPVDSTNYYVVPPAGLYDGNTTGATVLNSIIVAYAPDLTVNNIRPFKHIFGVPPYTLRLTFSTELNGGYYTLTFGDQTTGHIAYNANAAAIQAALEALSNVGTGNVTVTQLNPPENFDVVFKDPIFSGTLTADMDNLLTNLVLTNTKLSDYAAEVTGVHQVSRLVGDSNVTSGTDHFTLNGPTGGNWDYFLPWNQTASYFGWYWGWPLNSATVEGDDLPGGTWTMTFVCDYASHPLVGEWQHGTEGGNFTYSVIQTAITPGSMQPQQWRLTCSAIPVWGYFAIHGQIEQALSAWNMGGYAFAEALATASGSAISGSGSMDASGGIVFTQPNADELFPTANSFTNINLCSTVPIVIIQIT